MSSSSPFSNYLSFVSEYDDQINKYVFYASTIKLLSNKSVFIFIETNHEYRNKQGQCSKSSFNQLAASNFRGIDY